jgi:hypothetical protein
LFLAQAHATVAASGGGTDDAKRPLTPQAPRTAGLLVFSRRAVVAELEKFRSPTTLGYRIAWV